MPNAQYSPLAQQMFGVGQMPKAPVRPQSFDIGKFLTNLLPAAGGIVGSIGGTVLEPGLGTVAGGAGGQALGEFLKNLFTGQQQNAGDIAKQAAIGGLFGLLPGGEEVQGAADLGKGAVDAGAQALGDTAAQATGNAGSQALPGFFQSLLGRGVAGAGLGAGTQAIQDFNPSQPGMGENLGKLGGAALGGAAANEVIPGLMDILGRGVNYVGKTLPQEITNALEAKKNQIYGNLVGANNVDQAINEGILPRKLENMNVNQLQGYATEAKKRVEDLENNDMNNLLTKTGSNTMTVGDLVGKLQNVFNTAPQDEIGQIVKTSQPAMPSWLENLIPTAKNQAARDTLKSVQDNSQEAAAFLKKFLPSAQTKDGIDFNKELSASDINGIKRNIAKYYSKNQLYKDLYSQLRGTVENLSSNGDAVKALNQRIHGLTEIGGNIQNRLEKNSALPQELLQAADSGISNKTPRLQGATNIANGLMSLLGYSFGHFPGYIVAKGIEPTADKMVINPTTAGALRSAYNSLPQGNQAAALRQLFQQLGIRLGSSL